MSKTKAFIEAARLRTLPLSVSGIIVGSAMAMAAGGFRADIFALCILTTIGLQVISNFANDYGDGVKGTDNEDRVGPVRALQSGAVTPAEMKKAVIISSVITLALALVLIYVAFGKDNFLFSVIFFILGLAAVIAAIRYTVGASAYGYRGLGDVFVFIFFGLVSVAGSYFLYEKTLPADIWLPATTVGLLSVGVLNLNNIRDRRSDIKAGKFTMAVKLGSDRARLYHWGLLLVAMILSALYLLLNFKHPINTLFLLSYIPLGFHLRRFYNTKTDEDLDPELKKLAISTFLYSVLFMMSFNIFL